MRKIGIDKKNNVVYRSSKANNEHVMVAGKSGTGKTSMMLYEIISAAEAGEKTIVFNWHNTLNRNCIMPELLEKYEKYVKVIDVSTEGLKLPLFTPIIDSNGNAEKDDVVIGRVTSLFQVACGLSPTQEAQVYEAVKDIYKDNLYAERGIRVLMDWLMTLKKAVAKNSAAKMRSICENNIFTDGNFLETDAKIYEIDLNGLEYDVQLKVINFLLDYILRLAHKECFMDGGINLFIDEAQNLTYTEQSTMYNMINESRRLKLRVMLAFPSFFSGNKKGMDVVTQCGTTMYFQPLDEDIERTARLINPRDTGSVVFALSRLEKGECIACGQFVINGRDINGPVRLTVDLRKGGEDDGNRESESLYS